MKKKILGMLIAVMMVGAIAGCGNTENADTPTTADTVQETETETNNETVEVADTTEDTEVVAENVDLGGKEPAEALCRNIKSACHYTMLDPAVDTDEDVRSMLGTELTFSFNGNILTITPEVDDVFKESAEYYLNLDNWSEEDFYSGDVTVVIVEGDYNDDNVADSYTTTVTYGDIVVK